MGEAAEDIKHVLCEAVSRLQSDSSWIKPRRLTEAECQDRYMQVSALIDEWDSRLSARLSDLVTAAEGVMDLLRVSGDFYEEEIAKLAAAIAAAKEQ